MFDLVSLNTMRTELADDLRKGQETGEVRDDIDASALAMGMESVVVSLLMAYLQAGRGQNPERGFAVVALLDAALRKPG
jgi:hypothetical protein